MKKINRDIDIKYTICKADLDYIIMKAIENHITIYPFNNRYKAQLKARKILDEVCTNGG